MTHLSGKQNSLTDADPYAVVGGLDKQISQIRDLVDFPLTRPDLFQRFGPRDLVPITHTS
jgi:ATP-dependent 26S proteasome regulatory subunit